MKSADGMWTKVEGKWVFTNRENGAPGAAPPYPNNHRNVRDGLQYYLRVFGVFGVIAGVIGGFAEAAQVQTDYGFIIWGDAIGAGIMSCLLLFVAAAIIDALRVMAANSFREEASTPEADPSAQTPPDQPR